MAKKTGHRVNVNFPKNDYLAMKKLAKTRASTVSEMVRQFVANGLDKMANKDSAN